AILLYHVPLPAALPFCGSTKALEIKNLAMALGDDLLFDDLNLLVRHGERVGLIGPNGAGKSVLFRLVLGELEPFAGEIKIGPSRSEEHTSELQSRENLV